jgi:hypothetical protein
MLFKNSVRTSKRTPHFTITKINWIMLFGEIIAVGKIQLVNVVHIVTGVLQSVKQSTASKPCSEHALLLLSLQHIKSKRQREICKLKHVLLFEDRTSWTSCLVFWNSCCPGLKSRSEDRVLQLRCLCFSSVPQGKCRSNAFTFFPIHYSLIILDSMLQILRDSKRSWGYA